jgi:hypothetical protein
VSTPWNATPTWPFGKPLVAICGANIPTAEADLVGSATLVAVILTVPDGAATGAVYSPPLVIVPQAAPLHPAPETLHATAVFADPETSALNCCAVPKVIDGLVGVTVTATVGTTVTVAEADLVESAVLTAVTVTLAGEGATGEAEYTAVNPLVDSDPQVEPLQPTPVTFQLTAVFDVPVTLALKVCVPAVAMETLAGLRLNKTAAAATMVTLAEADFVESAALVALTVTDGGKGTLIGATYSPLAEIVPHPALMQPAPLTVHVMAVLEVPLTFAEKACVFPTASVRLLGFRMMAPGTVLTVSVATLLATLPAELLTTTTNWAPVVSAGVV